MASSSPKTPTAPPFPTTQTTAPQQSQPATTTPTSPTSPTRRSRNSTNASSTSAASRLRSASIKLMEATPPPGMWAATGSVVARAPSISDIRTGSFSTSGWNGERQRERRASMSDQPGISPIQRKGTLPIIADRPSIDDNAARPSASKDIGIPSPIATTPAETEPFPALEEEDTCVAEGDLGKQARNAVPVAEKAPVYPSEKPSSEETEKGLEETSSRLPKEPQSQYANGYIPPPKLSWKTSTAIALRAFWIWFLTPSGFLITLYGLNVVAWGGMLFLLLCNAAPAMCHPTCDDIQSPRRIWVEIDSQILNALFCVTGFGLAPWRSRDLYWLAVWRFGGKKQSEKGIRRLAGIHRGWFRLPGSDKLDELATAETLDAGDPRVPIPLKLVPDPPPTGIRAPPTNGWKMDFVVWMNMWNTFFQIILCYFMWAYSRHNRPSWATGLFVALGCIVAGVGGIMMYVEGKAVKKVEGIPTPKQPGPVEDVEAQKESTAAAGGETAEVKK